MKTVTRGFGDNVNCYQPKDVEHPLFQKIVGEAKELWKTMIADTEKRNGDRGACVMGAGIYIHFLDKNKRKPGKLCIIDPQSLASTQGENAWTVSSGYVIRMLKQKGIHSWFEPGRMD